MYTIYYIKNKITDEYYVGQTSEYERRMEAHIKSAKNPKTRLSYALSNYGIDNFEFSIITEVDTKDEAAALEKFYVKQFNSYLNGYNMTVGGDKNHKGEKRTLEQRQRISEGTKKGMNRPGLKEYLSEKAKGRPAWNKGIPMTDETKAKLSASKKGKKLTFHIPKEELFVIRSAANKKTNADRHWYTNGKEDVRIHSDEISYYISIGYVSGRTQANGKGKSHKRQK